MMIPFTYTRYKNSVLASIISLIGSSFIVGGVFLGVAFVAESVTGNSGKAANIEELAGAVLSGALIAAMGWLLTRWAKRIAEKKLKKELKAAKSVHVCSHCGNSLAPDDVFCFKCGTRRGSR